MRGALNAAALGPGKPELHSPAGHRKGARFAQSEKKARGEERTKTERGAGQWPRCDHQDMMTVRTRLGPKRSPSHPAGICPSA